MRKVNGKLISKLNIFALMIVICLAMLFSGFTDFNQVYADETQDVEVSNLEGKIEGVTESSLSFDLNINHKVKQGEEIVLKLGYDKVDNNDNLRFWRNAFGQLYIKDAGGVQESVGTVELSYDHMKLIFNKKAEKYDNLKLNISLPKGIYDLDSWSTTNSKQDIKYPFYLTKDGKNITKNDGVMNRIVDPYEGLPYFSTGELIYNNAYELKVYVGKASINSLKSGDITIEIPKELVANAHNKLNGDFRFVKKPDKDRTTVKTRYMTKADDNSLSVTKIEDNKVTLHFDKDKFKSNDIEGVFLRLDYKDGLSYKEDPASVIKIDYTGIGGRITERKIEREKINTGGAGITLDVSKYQPEASPIIVHKGDELSNKKITDHVIIKDNDGKTVKAEDINASKTRVDNNKIDTNTVGDYSATVNVEYKDGSTENVTVPIKVIDNVIPNLPDENGKNPEKPDGYVTVTMNAGQHGMLAKGEAKEYFVNPEKVVTIPAKDAIGKLGYKFSKWDSPLKAQFKNDKTINAKYKEIPDVIPNVPDHNGKKPEKPDGYVTVVVDPGNNGKLDPRDAGEYFVNPTKEVTIPIHNAVPNDGYKFNKWSPSKTGHFDHDMTIKAKYLAKGNANKPQTGDNGIEIPLAILISTIGMAFVAVKTKKHI